MKAQLFNEAPPDTRKTGLLDMEKAFQDSKDYSAKGSVSSRRFPHGKPVAQGILLLFVGTMIYQSNKITLGPGITLNRLWGKSPLSSGDSQLGLTGLVVLVAVLLAVVFLIKAFLSADRNTAAAATNHRKSQKLVEEDPPLQETQKYEVTDVNGDSGVFFPEDSLSSADRTVPDGKGRMEYNDGRVFVGLYNQGDLVQGKMTYSATSYYEGRWKNGTRHGKGTFVFVDGSVYKGIFRDGLFNGFGKMTMSHGGWYEGGWKDGKMDGCAKVFDAHGKLICVGTWRNGLRRRFPKAKNGESCADTTMAVADAPVKDDVSIDTTMAVADSSQGRRHFPKSKSNPDMKVAVSFAPRLKDDVSIDTTMAVVGGCQERRRRWNNGSKRKRGEH